MKKLISLLLSCSIVFTFCGVREFVVLGLNDIENPNFYGASDDLNYEMTDGIDLLEERLSLLAEIKKGVKCVVGLTAFVGIIAGGTYLLSSLQGKKTSTENKVEFPNEEYDMSAVKEFKTMLPEVNFEQIENLEVFGLLLHYLSIQCSFHYFEH